MEWKEIGFLLEKYYEGNTSRDEEERLRQALRRKDLPAEWHADRDAFLGLAAAKDAEPGPGFEDRLTAAIREAAGGRKRFLYPRRSPGFMFAAAAAGVALLVAGYFVLQTSGIFRSSPRDTFSDPRLAYQETRNTLLLVSQLMNKGTEPLSNISKLDDGARELGYIKVLYNGMDPLGSLESFETGVKKMEALEKIQEVKQMLQKE